MQQYRSVENRYAVGLSALHSISSDALSILQGIGFRVLPPEEVDVVAIARGCVGESRYRRTAAYSLAPKIVDCSSLVKWVYGRAGVYLPRWAELQYHRGNVRLPKDVRPGDLLFASAITHTPFTIGHVGILTDANAIVHAAGPEHGVVEVSLLEFMEGRRDFGVRGYREDDTITLECPAKYPVEEFDEFKYLIESQR